jgi:hypothetical protein
MLSITEIIMWDYVGRVLRDQLGVDIMPGDTRSSWQKTAMVVTGTGEPLIGQEITMCKPPKRGNDELLRYLDISKCEPLTGRLATEAMKMAKEDIREVRKIRSILRPKDTELVYDGDKLVGAFYPAYG